MTAAERERLRLAVSSARRANIRHAPNAGARNPALRPGPTPEETERQRSNQRAWRSREAVLVDSLDEWQWEAA